MTNFKHGDKVRNQDGSNFSNGMSVVTVDSIDSKGNVWLKETNTCTYGHAIELASPFDVQEVIETKIKKLKEEITLLETALSVIKKIGDK